MANRVYSLVLNDEVVQAIDAMAGRQGVSRSAMINRILAHSVAYVTPEIRIKSILENVVRLADEGDVFRILMGRGDNSLTLKSTFNYKYNPSVKYYVAFNTQDDKTDGELRVEMRTQNAALLNEFKRFINFWVKLEQTYLPERIPVNLRYRISPGKLLRQLYLPRDCSDDELGERIGEYIGSLDEIFKQYFNNAEPQQLEQSYVKKLNEGKLRV